MTAEVFSKDVLHPFSLDLLRDVYLLNHGFGKKLSHDRHQALADMLSNILVHNQEALPCVSKQGPAHAAFKQSLASALAPYIREVNKLAFFKEHSLTMDIPIETMSADAGLQVALRNAVLKYNPALSPKAANKESQLPISLTVTCRA